VFSKVFWIFFFCNSKGNFGRLNLLGCFPSSQPKVTQTLAPGFTFPVWKGSNKAVEFTSMLDRKPDPHATKKYTDYQCFDENFFHMLQNMQWNRDQGIVEMVPIIVGTRNTWHDARSTFLHHYSKKTCCVECNAKQDIDTMIPVVFVEDAKVRILASAHDVSKPNKDSLFLKKTCKKLLCKMKC